jgi:hypothetical protein
MLSIRQTKQVAIRVVGESSDSALGIDDLREQVEIVVLIPADIALGVGC